MMYAQTRRRQRRLPYRNRDPSERAKQASAAGVESESDLDGAGTDRTRWVPLDSEGERIAIAAVCRTPTHRDEPVERVRAPRARAEGARHTQSPPVPRT